MRKGMYNHLELTVSDMARSKAFYGQLLEFMGYQYLPTEGEPHELWYKEEVSAFALFEAKQEFKHLRHQRYAPGFHHLAFDLDSREEVDAIYELAKRLGAEVLDPPAEYDYTPGYYAVFFEDPDGMKLEFVYMPPFDKDAFN